MSKGKFEQKGRHRRRRFGSKSTALVLALVLLVGGVIGGTVAWLTDKTEPVQNTFSTSDITITLQEHTYDPATHSLTGTETEDGNSNYKMVPGCTIPKDPWVTVQANSEDCYLFIKVTKSENFSDYMTYGIDTTVWTELTGEDGVFYKKVESKNADQEFYILTNNLVTVKDTVTKEDMKKISSDDDKPSISFTAYAVQLYKSHNTEFSVAEAWTNAKGVAGGNGDANENIGMEGNAPDSDDSEFGN